MNFTSQICTSREQSERLLAFGLKKETADCYYYAQQRWTGNDYENTGELNLCPLFNEDDKGHYAYLNETFQDEVGENDTPYVLPAWSLHRLIEMMPYDFTHNNNTYELYVTCEGAGYDDGEDSYSVVGWWSGNTYDDIIDCIEWLIKEGYFNKEYLEE